jgi:hypothetical protein
MFDGFFANHHHRRLIIKLALLCILATYGLAAVHQHANSGEFHACLVCQVVDHHPLQSLKSPPPLLVPLAVLFIVAQISAPRFVHVPRLFERPRSRAPPSA